jgi:hypothetical protein
MKTKFFALLLATFAFTIAFAQKPQRVKGYTKKDGTYVAPSVRTKGNKTQTDNYSTKGNSNPYSGKKGTKKAKY